MDRKAIDKIEIPFSRTKIWLCLALSCVFVMASSWIWISSSKSRRYNPIETKLVSIGAGGFFGLCGLWCFLKLADKRPGLIVDAEGIVDHSSALALGRVPWADISGIRTTQVGFQQFLTVDVVDTNKYSERGFFIPRKLRAMNQSMSGSPINISSNALQISSDELVDLVSDSLERYRVNGNAEEEFV